MPTLRHESQTDVVRRLHAVRPLTGVAHPGSAPVSEFLFRGGHLNGQRLSVPHGPEGFPPVVMTQAPSDVAVMMRGPDDPAYDPNEMVQPIRYFRTPTGSGHLEYRVSESDWIRELERQIAHLEKRLGER